MEELIIQRIKKVISDRNLSITALGKKIGVVQQTLNRQMSGDSAMPLSTIDKFLSSFPEVSAEWLLRGDGKMMKEYCSPGEDVREFVVCIDENGFLKIKNESNLAQ